MPVAVNLAGGQGAGGPVAGRHEARPHNERRALQILGERQAEAQAGLCACNGAAVHSQPGVWQQQRRSAALPHAPACCYMIAEGDVPTGAGLHCRRVGPHIVHASFSRKRENMV